jgi:hypothetical protein
MTITDRRSGSASASTASSRLGGLPEGLGFKTPCYLATTANITLSGVQTIDGVSATAGKRVLVKDQTTATENGIYDVAAGNWTRSPDFSIDGDVVEGTRVWVTDGTANSSSEWVVSTADDITIDTSNISFTEVTFGGGTPGGSNTQVQFNDSSSFGGSANLTWVSPALTIGAAGSTTGQLKLTGSTSGTITVQGQAAAGTFNFNLPVTAGASGDILLSGGGTTNPMTWLTPGTGVATALAVNVGSAGAFVTFNGALGTPSSATLTNATGLPIAGITGLGTGVGTALAVNTGSAGAFVLFDGAGGTPSSLTLTNATGLPVAGITASTTTALGVGSIELGHATDTTLSRASAGVLAVEGVNVLTTATGQPLDADLTSWAGVTRAAGFDTWVATPSSANLASLVTDETGSGALVFATSPIFRTDVDISATSSAMPANLTGTALHIAGDDAVTVNVLIDAFAAIPEYAVRRAAGTRASPSALQSAQVIFGMNGYGYGATGYAANSRIRLQGAASENWTDAAQGTSFTILTTATGTTTTARAITAHPSGAITAGTSTTDLGVSGAIGAGAWFAAKTPTTTTNTSYSVATTDHAVIFNCTGTATITMLSAATYPGRMLYFKTITANAVNSGSSDVVPVTSDAAGTAILAATDGKWAILQSDGTNWIIMATGDV